MTRQTIRLEPDLWRAIKIAGLRMGFTGASQFIVAVMGGYSAVVETMAELQSKRRNGKRKEK